jgi:tetratricopeptide (TPR) repeat protein
MEFAESMNQDNVLSLRELNSGFQRPDTISLAYFQASILVEHIVEKHGAEVLQGLVRAYGDGLETEQALATVELDFDSLQTSFNEAIEDQFGSLRLALQRHEEPENILSEGNEDIAVLRERVSQQPGNFWAQFALGRALFYSGEFDDARVAFQFAGALAPMATGFDSPSGFLARIAQEEGDREAAKNHLESLLEYDETSLDAVRLLAALAEETADRERMRHAYERHNEIDPFDPIPHQALGRLAMADGLFAEAIEELEVALALGPVDRVSAYSDFAESLLAIGDLDGAKRQAIAALEIAPTYERAQDLLLKAVETK